MEDGVAQRIRAFDEVRIPVDPRPQPAPAGGRATPIEPDAVSNLRAGTDASI